MSKRFGRLQALDAVSFTLPAGRRTALVGPNGSGKSTLNRALLGLIGHEGSIRLEGEPASDRRGRSARLAYVPQTPPGFGARVRDVMAAVARVRRVELKRLESLTARLELDLSEVANASFRTLSGGMRQKLLVALALASEASLRVLDEPTASLDARSRETFFELCGELPRETSVLLCSHRLEEIRPLVEHVLALEEGRVVYDGSAVGFLEASAMSAIEVQVVGERAEAWLREQGFRPAGADWWLRVVLRAEKRRLLVRLGAELGDGLRDVNVRELQALELPNAGRRGEGRDG